MTYPSIRLRQGREQSVLRKHPWIFSGAIASVSRALEDGETVIVEDAHGQPIGTGHFQNSSLAVRLVDFHPVSLDEAFWEVRLREAAQYRQSLGIVIPGETNAFRLIHGEGDQLPGLIIDIYGDTAVVQAHSIGMHKAVGVITAALLRLSSPEIRHVYDKSHETLPPNYGAGQSDGWQTAAGSTSIQIREGGLQFEVDVAGGQKTGFFLDQRENRYLVRRYAAGKNVLNCFSYTGGFSLYALAGHATRVVSIDSSAPAIALLDRNIAVNGFQDRHSSHREEVVKSLHQNDELYDLIIVDPPAFAKSLAKRHNAVQAYKRLNVLAMKRLKPGGMLFTFSCSQVVDRPLFHNTIVAAAIEAGRQARIMHDLGQGPDHPVSIHHPEGSYLKGLALYLD